METLFVILCVAIGIGIPCYIRRIRTLETARLVSKLYLIFAISLFASGIALFAITKETPYTAQELCEICSGSGIRANGKTCLLCLGAGEYAVYDTLYSIPLLYPICMVALSIYTIILWFALQELIEYLAAEEAEFPPYISNTGKTGRVKSYCKRHRAELSNGTYCPYCMRILSPDDIDLQ